MRDWRHLRYPELREQLLLGDQTAAVHRSLRQGQGDTWDFSAETGQVCKTGRRSLERGCTSKGVGVGPE